MVRQGAERGGLGRLIAQMGDDVRGERMVEDVEGHGGRGLGNGDDEIAQEVIF